MPVIIEPENDDQHDDVRAVIEAAFGQSQEAHLVDALRAAGDARISLIALQNGELIGHVLLSPMRAPSGALGLAPVSVMPGFQRQGVGARLIRAGLACAEAEGWAGVFVLGDQNYYARFGFTVARAERFASVFSGPYFAALEFVDGALGDGGAALYAPAFDDIE